MLYKVSVVERLAFQSVMNIASCLTGKKKKKRNAYWSQACKAQD